MKYIFLDIDGTLFDHKTYTVPKSACRAVELAREAGHKVFICTGRSCCMLDHVADIGCDGVVAAAGAYAEVEGEVIYEENIPDEELKSVLKFCRSKGVSYVLEGKKGIYMHHEIRDYFFIGNGRNRPGHEFFKQKSVYRMEDYRPEEEVIYKFCLYAWKTGVLQEVEKELADRYQFVYSLLDREEMYSVEVISIKNNKAVGVRKVLEHYGGSMEDAVAVGDSLNDIEMIQECGIGIVMGNGDERLKPYADYVTADIGEDGVYRALEHYELLGQREKNF